MKKNQMIRKTSRLLTTFFMLPAFLFFAASCSDDDDETPVDLNAITNLPGTVSLSADQVTNTATLKFTALSDWEASSNENPQWFTFEPKKGTAGEVTINITAPYNEGAAKTGKLTIKHGTNTYPVNIEQAVGKPDVAKWDETNQNTLRGIYFAQDPYNATEEHPISYTLKLTSKKDYTTLEDAPFEIFTFYSNETNNYNAVDSLINWVEFEIAENSPAASAGKEIILTVKPHEQFDSTETEGLKRYMMNERNAYITIVPKGTQRSDMFVDGVLKEEYTGICIEQQAYTANIDLLSSSIKWMIMGENIGTIPGTAQENPAKITVNNVNFKRFDALITYQETSHSKDFLTVSTDNNEVSILLDKTKIEKNPNPNELQYSYDAFIQLKVYRGENLEPLVLKNVPSITVSAARIM